MVDNEIADVRRIRFRFQSVLQEDQGSRRIPARARDENSLTILLPRAAKAINELLAVAHAERRHLPECGKGGAWHRQRQDDRAANVHGPTHPPAEIQTLDPFAKVPVLTLSGLDPFFFGSPGGSPSSGRDDWMRKALHRQLEGEPPGEPREWEELQRAPNGTFARGSLNQISVRNATINPWTLRVSHRNSRIFPIFSHPR